MFWLPELLRILISADYFFYSCSAVLLIAYGLDCLLGEPKRWHPLVGFGLLAARLERALNDNRRPVWWLRITGLIAWLLLVLPLPLLLIVVQPYLSASSAFLVQCLCVYLALGLSSLAQHGMQVYRPLQTQDLANARHFTGYLVSRETASLSAEQMSRATTESMLENGHDAVIATFVAFMLGGAPLVIAHRLANTLDAMWGYKTSRFVYFGWAAARLDDALGFVSAKVCSVLYALQGRFRACMYNAYKQGSAYKSHNGGWVMASGATALNIRLGGTARYNGQACVSPILGQGRTVDATDILRSVSLVRRAAVVCILISLCWDILGIAFI